MVWTSVRHCIPKINKLNQWKTSLESTVWRLQTLGCKTCATATMVGGLFLENVMGAFKPSDVTCATTNMVGFFFFNLKNAMAIDGGFTDLAPTVTHGPLQVPHEKFEPFNNLF